MPSVFHAAIVQFRFVFLEPGDDLVKIHDLLFRLTRLD